MANYNTFVVYDCKKRKSVLVTSSARKASKLLMTGFKIEVWNDNRFIQTIYQRNRKHINAYIDIEKQYIADKQNKATLRNNRRRN